MKRNAFLASLFGLTNLPFPKLYQDKAAAPPNSIPGDGSTYGRLCQEPTLLSPLISGWGSTT